MPTSAISLVSCAHGRQRRAERHIDRRDLQSAIKHGTRSPARPCGRTGLPRWRFEYDGVVYITDNTCRREITSYRVGPPRITEPIPLTKRQLAQLRDSARHVPSAWTSHTVLVVDGSGSMKQQDAAGAYDRSDAVWTAIALDFLAEQLERGRASSRDVVSVVYFNDSAHVLVDCAPLDARLFNRVLELRDTVRPRSHGNYLPALAAAGRLLLPCAAHGACALALLFLSDGRPSDRLPPGPGAPAAKYEALVRPTIEELASRVGRRLTLGAVGFGPATEDFSVLRAMVAEAAEYGACAQFTQASLGGDRDGVPLLASAFSSVSASLTSTRTELTALHGSAQLEVRSLRREALGSLGAADDDPWEAEWMWYTDAEWVHCLKLGVGGEWEEAPPFSARAAGVAVHECIMGEGAERVVHRFRELSKSKDPIGPPLVAKESRFVAGFREPGQQRQYYLTFCKTQAQAAALADAFNDALDALRATHVPRVRFLECRVYVVRDKVWGEYGMLVERRLDVARYVKYNNNAGRVLNGDRAEGAAGGSVAPLLPPPGPAAGPAGRISSVIEEGSDEEGWETATADTQSASDAELSPRTHARARRPASSPRQIVPTDVPQAFTHFTHAYTRGKMMVCDLQGVFEPRARPPTFELTDPVIHFASNRGRVNVYGRTDRGREGMRAFFRTHTCNGVCTLLGLDDAGRRGK